MRTKLVSTFGLLAVLWVGIPRIAVAGNTAAEALIQRILPTATNAFACETIAPDTHGDVFEIESRADGRIALRGSDGVSIACALNHYLKFFCHCQISWCGDNLALPPTLPSVPQKVRVVCTFPRRVYLNYCTFSYTMPWWDWDRWQREIDWMAMHGINMPLAITGQEGVWQAVLRKHGMSDDEIRAFLCGPAFFAWQWMANLEGWGGPLPQSWIDSHVDLGRKILGRERELGMTPILQGFTGFVPRALSEKEPQAKIQLKPNWAGTFPGTAQLDPLDPLFATMGRQFIEEQTKLFGTDHWYAADPFHESQPPSSDAGYLPAVAKTVLATMESADPDARIVMQTWSLREALVRNIPEDRILLLALQGGGWQNTQGFWGRPWVCGVLHNYGGRSFMAGSLPGVLHHALSIRANPKAGPSTGSGQAPSTGSGQAPSTGSGQAPSTGSGQAPSTGSGQAPSTGSGQGHVAGIGLFPEAIEQNPILYEAATEIAWHDQPPEPAQWIADYIHARYGRTPPQAQEAWRVLAKTLYTNGAEAGSAESPICSRPALAIDRAAPNAAFKRGYDVNEVWNAWAALQDASTELGAIDTYRYDLVDVARQCLADLSIPLQQDIAGAYKAGDAAGLKQASQRFLELIDDLDTLLGTRKEFLLGAWLADARRWGTNEAERRQYERNARLLVTTWGKPAPDALLFDYSNRQWSGLLRGFYKTRWQRFLAYLAAQPAGAERFTDEHLHKSYNRPADDANPFYKELSQWEFSWCDQTETYAAKPQGDSVAVARALLGKWRPLKK